MSTKLLKFGFLIAIFVLNLGVLGYLIRHLSPTFAAFGVESNRASAATEQNSVPIRIDIPAIKLSADVENVGMMEDGSMGSPKFPDHAGWLNNGVAPGDIGSAVMAGHVNWWNGADTAFARLHTLAVGDRIIVKDNRDIYSYFVVREMKKYLATADAESVFTSSDGLSHLNLITCGGEWDEVAKHYSERLVVFADKEV